MVAELQTLPPRRGEGAGGGLRRDDGDGAGAASRGKRFVCKMRTMVGKIDDPRNGSKCCGQASGKWHCL